MRRASKVKSEGQAMSRKTLEKLLLFAAYDDNEPCCDLRIRLVAIGAIVGKAMGDEPKVPPWSCWAIVDPSEELPPPTPSAARSSILGHPRVSIGQQ